MSDTLIERYSASLPADKQALVRRVQPVTDGSRFRTRVCFPVEEEGGTDWQTGHKSFAWREARKEPETGLWSVIHYKNQTVLRFDTELGPDQGGGTDDVTISRDVLETGLCFFDALYACASFEVFFDQADYEAIAPQPSPQDLGEQYYRHFAEAQGIIFHKKTLLPVPVADAEILDDRVTLGLKDIDIAERSRGNLAPQEALQALTKKTAGFLPQSVEGHDLPSSADQALVKVKDVTHKGRHILNVNRSYKKQAQTLSRLHDKFLSVNKHSGRRMVFLGDLKGDDRIGGVLISSGTGLLALAGCVLPLAPIVAVPLVFLGATPWLIGVIGQSVLCLQNNGGSPAHVAKNIIYRPGAHFKRDLKAMYKDAARWPEDSPQRQAGTWLARQFDCAGHAVMARHDFCKASQSGSWLAAQRSKQSLQKLDKALMRCDVPEDIKRRTFAAVIDENLSSHFVAEVRDDLYEKIKEYNALMARIQEQEITQIKQRSGPS